jgi:hypothetical protein
MASKRPPKKNPLDETIVEELTKDGWQPFAPYSIFDERDGQYTVTLRVRTKKGPKRVPDKALAKLADELYDAFMMEPYPLDKGSPYERLMSACRTRRR